MVASRYVSGICASIKRRAQREERLAGEQRRAFGDREEVAGEAQAGEHVEEAGAGVRELRQRAEIVDLLRGEAQVQEILDRLCKARRQNEVAIVRQAADEQLKGGALFGLAGLEIARRHGELIEVGESSASDRQLTYFFFSVWRRRRRRLP